VKPPRSTAARKPPVPTDSHAEIEDWLGSMMPGLQPLLRCIDELIREVLPGLRYAIKWKRAWYELPGRGWVIELAAYDVSANVVFHGGADFEPPPPLGETGRVRYVKLRSIEEAQGPELRAWIEQAGRTDGWT
jgi:hypothetical protein